MLCDGEWHTKFVSFGIDAVRGANPHPDEVNHHFDRQKLKRIGVGYGGGSSQVKLIVSDMYLVGQGAGE